MRDTFDYGIDLGTTNSVIAQFTGEEAEVVKNNERAEYTPSVVWLPRPGQVYVGRTARDQLERRPWNVHAEFKTHMGLDGMQRHFREAGVALSPPQLSAEVLKSLRFDCSQQGDEAPVAAVITVPAAFKLHQTNATMEAAKLAGFQTSALVQEPTAAAYAHDFHTTDGSYCMVFDFGGGTFDAAVVRAKDGELQVLHHVGDTNLGGKVIDWAVVDRILAPAAVRAFGLRDFTRDNPGWEPTFHKLKHAAENAKVQLSQAQVATIDVDIRVGNDLVPLEYQLTRGEVDAIAEPLYVRAVNLCRKALNEASLRPDDIDRLLLVGGMTLAPTLREMLADGRAGLGIALDHSQDPSTVVARGAAVFASTVPMPADSRPPPVAGEFTVDLEYPRVTDLPEVTVAGTFHSGSPVDWTGYRVMLENPTGARAFRSPQVMLDESGRFAMQVLTDEGTTTVQVHLVGPAGVSEKVTPSSFSIRHGLDPGRPVLTNSIGICQADGTFARMLEKGAQLPATADELFQTTIDLHRSGTDDVIRIPVMEGERERAERNLQVAVIEIRPRDLRFDLPRGSDVEITVEVDESRLVTVVANVPVLNTQFDVEVDLSTVQPPEVANLRRDLDEVERRLGQARQEARESGSAQAQGRLTRLDDEQLLERTREEVRAAETDPGSAADADEHLREIQSVLDEVEDDIERPALRDALTGELTELRHLVGRVGDSTDRAELEDLQRRADKLHGAADSEDAKELMLRAIDLQRQLLRRDGTLDVHDFYLFRANQHRLEPPASAVRSLLDEGERAIARRDTDALAGVVERLRRRIPNDESSAQGGVHRWLEGGRG